MISKIYTFFAKTLNDRKQSFLAICVIVLVTLGLVVPIYRFIYFDPDSISYGSRSIDSSIGIGFRNWGIYRSLAITFKALIFTYFDLSNIYLPLSVVIAFLSRIIFLKVLISSFRLNSNFFVFFLISSVCNIFFIDTFTLMSRALNDLLGSLIAILFMYFQGKFEGKKLILLTFLSLILGLVGYDSYIYFSILVAFSMRRDQRSNIFFSSVVGLLLIYFMNVNHFFLRHPKFKSPEWETQAVESSFSVITFLGSKYNQFLVSISGVNLLTLLISLIFGCLLYVVLVDSLKPVAEEKLQNFGRSQIVSGGLLIGGSSGVIILAYLIGANGPANSKLQWLVLSVAITIFSIGTISVIPISRFFVSVLGFVYSVIFGASVLLILQLSNDLKGGDYCKLQAGIFRNITTVVTNKSPSKSCD